MTDTPTPNPLSEVAVSCSGCGAILRMDDPSFPEWWAEHGECLRELHRARPEIDHRTREILRQRGGQDV